MIKSESKKFTSSRLSYPFTRYIFWHPVEEGNILLNDGETNDYPDAPPIENFSDYSSSDTPIDSKNEKPIDNNYPPYPS